MRSWTAFCAPEPSAIMVMTAPTPMMMPSMVSSDRSLLARSASSATRMISPSSTSGPARARQDEHGVLVREPGRHLDVVLVGKPGADRHRDNLPTAQGEHDVASRRRAARAGAAAAGRALELGSDLGEQRLLHRREILTGHPLREHGLDLLRRDAGGQGDYPPAWGGERRAGRFRLSRVELAAVRERRVRAGTRRRLASRGGDLLLHGLHVESEHTRR